MELGNENKQSNENAKNEVTVTQYNGPLKEDKGKFIDSIGFKLIVITVLMILLLLPASWIKDVIRERENMNIEAVSEVSNKWAGNQIINGPILTIPVTYKKLDGEKVVYNTINWNVLPKDLLIDGEVTPTKLRRGIYEVVVYKSGLKVNGNFALGDVPDTANLEKVHYEKAYITIGISDLRGIKNEIKFRFNRKNLEVEPGTNLTPIISKGITMKVPFLNDSTLKTLDFNFHLDLQGSKQLAFVPIGSNTTVSLSSPWSAPSFTGNFLPDTREISDSGFQAVWKVLELNRNFPQSFMGNKFGEYILQSKFGVNLIVPLDDYQKSFRSVKYAAMTIALTFLIFFLIEILTKQKIHPLQYTLVGLALCLFYILLVALSEHTNFNIAYGFSTFGIVAMISLYSLSIFKAKRMTWILISLLILIYSFLFVTLQLTDYALLMGSIGLVVILAATMFFTRKINWYELKIEE